jgi:uncharacterized membrane protein YjjB (DUF3815 family)
MKRVIVTASTALAIASGFTLAAPAPQAKASFPCPPGVTAPNCLTDGSNGHVIACTMGAFFGGCYSNLETRWSRGPDGSWHPD